jgi:hypothetical protein
MANYQLTRDQVINGALRLCGVLDPEETATVNQISTAAESLNRLCASWENKGLPLWKVKKHTVNFVANQNSYVISTNRPLEVTNMLLHNNISNADITMVRLSRQEYLLLGNKQSTGTPTQYYYEYDTLQGTFFVYPTPDQSAANNMQLQLWYREPFDTVDSASSIPDFPKEFVNALAWNLAVQLAPEYGVPQPKLGFLAKQAEKEEKDAFDYNIEHTSIYFNYSRYGGYQ